MNSIVSIQPRAIVHRTTGRTRGPITRLVSPGDLGQLLKPFVFLDRICFTSEPGKRIRHAPAFGYRYADLHDRRRTRL